MIELSSIIKSSEISIKNIIKLQEKNNRPGKNSYQLYGGINTYTVHK